MKLACLVQTFPSLSETFILRELTGLREQGFAVELAALCRPVNGDPVHAAAQVWEPLHYAPRVWSPHFIRDLWDVVHERHSIPRAFRAWRDEALALALARHTGPVQCVHAHFAFWPADVGARLASRLGVPFSLSVHARDVFAQAPDKLAKRLRFADCIVACTRMAADAVAAAAPECAVRVRLVHHGLPLDQFTPTSPCESEPDLILCIARLEPKKGLHVLIDACARLRRDGLTFRCAIAGNGTLRRELARRIQSQKLENRVALLGAVSQERALALYKEAALFCLPSIEAPDGDRDGLANTILEAMAMQRPVVSTTASAAGEAVINGLSGLLTPPGDADALARALAYLLRHPDLGRAMGQEARRVVENRFDLKRTSANLGALLKAAI